MKKLKVILPVALVVLLGLLPFLMLVGAFCFAPSQYTNTFYGELDDKYDRLSSIDTPKIVVVGGSSVAFGLNSQMIKEQTGYEVVNFGLYADLGTKIMLDLSEGHINEGDIVIIAPEMDKQTLSLYFNGTSTLKATDDKPSMLLSLKGEDWYDIWGSFWGFMKEKWHYVKEGAPDPEGVYNAGNFNEYGDIDPAKFPRNENIMGIQYDKTQALSLSSEIFSEDFVAYVNDYIDTLENRGATVYYSFCPMNELAIGTDAESSLSKEEQISIASEALLTYLESALHCPILGSPEEAIMPALYFYDSNFHLNDNGVPLHTARLIDQLLKAEEKTAVDAMGAVQGTVGYIWSDECFVYELQADGTAHVVGITPLAQNLYSLFIPGSSQGVAVSGIAENAFKDSRVLQQLRFASDLELAFIADNVFSEIYGLNGFYFYGNPPAAFPSVDKLGTTGAVIYSTKEREEQFKNAAVFASYPSSNISYSRMPEDSMWEQNLEDIAAVKNRGIVNAQDIYFIYTLLPNGTWEITGLTEFGKEAAVLMIPSTMKNEKGEDVPVTSVGDYAMKGATKARALVVPSGSNINQFGSYVFAESSVDGLYMYVDAVDITTVISASMVIGAPDSFKIYVSDGDRLTGYRQHYAWGVFGTHGKDYYAFTELSEEMLRVGDVSFDSSNDTQSLTKTLTFLLIVAAAIGFGALAYHVVLDIQKRKKATP